QIYTLPLHDALPIWSRQVPPPSGPTSSPRDRTPTHLADKIQQARAGLEGERKQVTVLFADVKGSMELAEQLDAEVWSAIMQRFLDRKSTRLNSSHSQ